MARVCLKVSAFNQEGVLVAQCLLGEGAHLIGRDSQCPVYLESEYISQQHARLHVASSKIELEDLKSTGGTWLDGVPLRGKLEVQPNQVIQLGDLTLSLELEGRAAAAPGTEWGGGRYQLVKLLGRGGMGEVWKAEDKDLDETVALKRLTPEVSADETALNDLRREVQKSRKLSHPHIIRIHDLVRTPGEDPFITMEFVEGRDLSTMRLGQDDGVFRWEQIRL